MRLRSANWRLLDDNRWVRTRRQPNGDAKRKGPAGTDGMSRGKPTNDRSGKSVRRALDDVADAGGARRLVARSHLAKHQPCGALQNAAESKLRQHPIDPVRPFVDV